jgi:hypothetical protein
MGGDFLPSFPGKKDEWYGITLLSQNFEKVNAVPFPHLVV